jgi:hypothetical protein
MPENDGKTHGLGFRKTHACVQLVTWYQMDAYDWLAGWSVVGAWQMLGYLYSGIWNNKRRFVFDS